MILRQLEGWPYGLSRDPSSQLDQILRDLGRLVVNGSPASRSSDLPAGVYPLMNVSQDSENFYVRSEVPGVKPEDLEVSVTGRGLTVSGDRKFDEEDPKVNYHRRERPEGKFRRQISLPSDVNAEKVQAQYRHGLLMVVIPKAENAKPRKVSITG